MEIALLVWAVDLLSKLGSFLNTLLGLLLGSIVIAVLVTGFALIEGEDFKPCWKKYFPTKILFATLFFVWIIPSQQTMKYIATGYLIQETFESEFVQETVTLSQKAVIKQLQIWAEDNTDIQELIKGADLPLPERIVKKES